VIARPDPELARPDPELVYLLEKNKMRIRFYCFLFQGGNPNDPCDLIRVAKLLDAEPPLEKAGKSFSEITRDNCVNRPYSSYLLPSLRSEFGTDIKYCEKVLAQISRLERKEIEHYRAGGNEFSYTMNQHEVVFENAVFDECYEWPLWTCPLMQFKVALQGWRKFLDIPKTIDSELITDLPEVTFHDIDND
jgi:hypothetical protein